ncbi:uncharacterized protein C8Q71DRAFT_328828 [Rhodofomes roseus]|uniref:G-patch domain-containing protein n=2 Tax=Rhodofomes roseus TaxID=34475 RepID=A0ABQ8KTU4_9APHY|nr:uncharacterized protein C8Q71DRAFT_328828 [Rhodofomes roseus]KAH9841423.1 hypothetical protein C8Q71DRAFT_328828 [Rhodofomes roseus]
MTTCGKILSTGTALGVYGPVYTHGVQSRGDAFDDAMPIDGHAYLVNQGWGGKGTGLRQGAISRPVAVTQKKSLAGVGKDRDEAFPFWDHVFEAAAMSIQVKIQNDDDDSDSEDTSTPTFELQRTKTGIISNRRPKTGMPALPGTATPDSQASGSGSVTPRLSVMAAAKQEAAKRILYANFFRGPVLGPNEPLEVAQSESQTPPITTTQSAQDRETSPVPTRKSRKGKERAVDPSPDVESAAQPKKQKKRSALDDDDASETKKEKKRRKREAKELIANEEVEAEGGKKNRRAEKASTPAEGAEGAEDGDRNRESEERKRRKAERRAAKEGRRRLKQQRKEAEVVPEGLSREPADESEAAGAAEDASRKRKKDKTHQEGRDKKKQRRTSSS